MFSLYVEKKWEFRQMTDEIGDLYNFVKFLHESDSHRPCIFEEIIVPLSEDEFLAAEHMSGKLFYDGKKVVFRKAERLKSR
jgi:hypothetical protein